MILYRYTSRHDRNVSFGSRKHRGLSLERRVERNSAHTCTYGYITAICPIQTTRNNLDSWWSLNNIVGSVSIPTQLAESRYDIVWVSKYVYKVVSSVDEYVRVYIRVEIRVYYKKKSGLDFCCGVLHTSQLMGISSSKFKTSLDLRNVPGRSPVLGPRILQVRVLA